MISMELINQSMSIGESLGVHKDFLIFFCRFMNSYEFVFVVFCIREPQERVHKNKIIIFILLFKSFKIFRIHE